MRVLVLWADGRSPNLGLRALGAGTASLVTSIWPQAEVVHHSYASRAAPAPMGSPRSAAKELHTGRGGVVQWLSQFDLVIDTRAGDSFADIYGLRRLVVQNLMAEAVRRSGAPLVFGPQTIGPFRSAWGRLLGGRALSHAAVVLAREPASAVRAEELGRPVTSVVTDVVFALEQPVVEHRRDVIINVSGRLWNSDAHGVVVPRSLDDARAASGGANLTIGARMHACLNSLSTSVPAISLAYSEKCKPLLGDLGWPYVVELSNSPAPAEQALRYAVADDLADRARDVRARADGQLDVARRALQETVGVPLGGVR